jgi:acetyltransferase-like isoleucine patch superfamily enzyme
MPPVDAPSIAHVSFGTRHNPPARGAVDRFIRRFSQLSLVLVVLALHALMAVAAGLALAPALWFVDAWSEWTSGVAGWLHWPALGLGYALAFFVFGFALLCIVPVCNWLLPTRAKPFKGGYFSVAAVPWLLHNGLFYLVRFTFLPFVTLTPMGAWFLSAMGMTLGKRVFVNTEYISDPRLITLGDDVVIGGSVHLFAHFGGGGHLTLAPVVIGARATIGEKATVMGDVQIGEDAVVLPHSVLLPGSRVGAGETWGGIPARRISAAEWQRLHDEIRGLAG